MSRLLRALIVEGQEEDALLLLRELQRSGYEPESVRVDTAPAMRAALKSQPWDIVISNCMIPHFGAIAVLELLAEEQCDIPLIIVTGTIDDETASAAMRAGAADYITKDNLARLAPVVERELRDAELRRDRKRIEETLDRERSLLNRTMETSPVSITVVNREGAIIFANAQAEKVLGLARDELAERTYNAPAWNITDYDGNPFPDKELPFSRVMATGEPVYGVRHAIEWPCGRRILLSVNAAPLFDEAGELDGMVATIDDVTERRQLESRLAAIHALGQKLVLARDIDEIGHSVIEAARQVIQLRECGLWLVDEEQQILVCRAHTAGLAPTGGSRFPLSSEKGITVAVARSGEAIYLPDTGKDSRYIPGDPAVYQSELCIPLKIGERVIGVLNTESEQPDDFSPLDRQLFEALASVTAIALENAWLFEQVERSEATLRSILSAAPIGIGLVTHRILGWTNQGLQNMVGYSDDELMGQSARMLYETDEEFERIGRERYAEIAKHGMDTVETRLRRKDGAVIDVLLSAAPIDREDLSAGVTFTAQDITERKRIDRELRMHRGHLEDLVAERTAELAEANRRLQALSRVKDEFVSNVSHELRTPITSLKLRHDLLTMNPEKFDVHLSVIRRETERLEHIIENLLYLSRLDQDRVSWNPRPMDLNWIVEQYIVDRTPLAEERGLALTFDRQPNLPAVLVDVDLLGQVLSILLTNALNYTPSGGWVTVATLAQEIDGERWAGFRISDNGPGILPEEMPHLFERFFRGKAGLASGVAGTGLGLAIVKEIVDRHQGRVEVLSEGVPGKGASFTVWLPVNE